jgi:cysteine desulfurase
MKTHYFDHVATNPLRPDVLEATAIEEARQEVARLVGAKPTGIVFTASGAEANNFALRGLALAKQDKGKHVIVTRVEHHSVLNAARFLEKSGFTVTFLSVDKHGIVEPEALKKAMTDETVLVSVIMASPEVGTVQPIMELAAVAKEHGALFHTDAVAAVGNIKVDVGERRKKGGHRRRTSYRRHGQGSWAGY